MEKKCEFDCGKCDIACGKYSMCAFMSIQKQLSSLQEQMNFLFSALGDIVENSKNEISNLDNKLEKFTIDMLDLINLRKDSETKKESPDNEEKNK